MSTAAIAITTEQLLAMPDDGMERELIRGELRERPMTVRNRFHSKIVGLIAYFLNDWLLHQPEPHGGVYAGEVGVILRHDPDTTVGIDVAYAPESVEARQAAGTTLLDGIPSLVVEVLSPSDKQQDVRDKVFEYLDAGVALVWVVDPDFHTVRVHQPNRPTELFNETHMLDGGEVLPGLSVSVSRIFAGLR